MYVLYGNVIVKGNMELNFINETSRNQSSIAHRLSLSPAHHPDMTEILLKRT